MSRIRRCRRVLNIVVILVTGESLVLSIGNFCEVLECWVDEKR